MSFNNNRFCYLHPIVPVVLDGSKRGLMWAYFICFFGLLGLNAASRCHADIVWAFSGSTIDQVNAIDTDGSNFRTLWQAPNPSASSPWGVAVDRINQRVFWSDLIGRSISSADYSGSNQQVHFTYSPASTLSMAVDSITSSVYFVAANPTNAIMRASYDGSNLEVVANISPTNSWLTVDSINRYLYFTESNANRIARVNLDGSPNVETVFTLASSNNARGIAVHNDFVYWVDNGDDILRRGKIGTNDIDELLELRTLTDGTAATPNGLATDGQFLYWTEGRQNFRGIYRSDMLGNNGMFLFDAGTLGAPLGIATLAVIPEPYSGSMLVIALAATLLIRRRNDK